MSVISYLVTVRKRISQHNPEARNNPWFLAWLVLVVIFLVVNGIFVSLAVYSNPGLVLDDYYEKGREYEQNALKLHAAQNALDWSTRFEIPAVILVGADDIFRFAAVDADGRPVTGADVQVHAYRPSDANADFTVALTPSTGGLYRGRLRFDLPGVWELTVRISRDRFVYQDQHRIYVEVP